MALINTPYSLLSQKYLLPDILELCFMENILTSTYTGIHWHLFSHQQVAKTVDALLEDS